MDLRGECMEQKRENRSLSERLYNVNVLPDGNLKSVEEIAVVLKRLEHPSDYMEPMDENQYGIDATDENSNSDGST